LQVTVSIGEATRDDKHATPEQLIKAADQALYKGKKLVETRSVRLDQYVI
jgi:PleD family two-component response regulator